MTHNNERPPSVPTTSSGPMAEQTMVERVARAICAADVLAPEPDAPIYIGVKSAKAWEARQPMARAAIEAMRPDPAKIIHASGEHFDIGYFDLCRNDDIPGIINKWIDAALKP